MFFEEVIEVGDFGKAQRIGNFGYRPGAVFQQNFSLLLNAFANDLRGRFLGGFFYRPV